MRAKPHLKLIYALPCKVCKREFLWTSHKYNDFRCDTCRKGESVEAVELEIAEMSQEELDWINKEIEEYIEEHGELDDSDDLYDDE